MSVEYDVIVAGGGPGGSTVAYELACRGVRVGVFEKQRLPRSKPCGGCLSLVVGGFFAGLGLGEGVGESSRQQLARGLEPLAFILVPFYFVLIGTRAEFKIVAEPTMVFLLVGLLLIAFIAKILGGFLGAVGTETLPARLLIGMSMVPRGEVGLIIASLGFAQGHLSHHAFVALVLVTIATSVLAPFVIVPLARLHQQNTIGLPMSKPRCSSRDR